MRYPKIIIEKESNKDAIRVEEHKLKTLASEKGYNLLLDYTSPNIAIRSRGQLKDRALFLDGAYDWIIVEDDEGLICLIAITKDRKMKEK